MSGTARHHVHENDTVDNVPDYVETADAAGD